MKLLNKYLLLIKRVDAKSKNCELKLVHIMRSEIRLHKQKELFEQQRLSITELMETLRFEGTTDLIGIFNLQRHVSVLRRQLVELKVEEAELSENIQLCSAEKSSLNSQKNFLRKKLEQYQYLLKREKLNERLLVINRDEIETEEIIICKR